MMGLLLPPPLRPVVLLPVLPLPVVLPAPPLHLLLTMATTLAKQLPPLPLPEDPPLLLRLLATVIEGTTVMDTTSQAITATTLVI